MLKKNKELGVILLGIILFFVAFLILPLGMLLVRSFQVGGQISINNYLQVLAKPTLMIAIKNSLWISMLAGMISTVLGFILAYTIHFTNIFKPLKKVLQVGVVLPMLLPTITYGFVIIYSFGKQGLITRLFGRELFEIYGFIGLLIGYVIYTLPSAFLLINNSLRYIDRKPIIVSSLMGDHWFRTLKNTIIRPLIGTLGGAFVLSFILSFTDFGVPASVGGTYEVVATQLYQQMLGSLPDLNSGSVIAMLMIIPAIVALFFLNYLERFNFRYDKISEIEIIKNPIRDTLLGTVSMIILVSILSVFIVMFITPFVKNWPYELTFTLDYFIETLKSKQLLNVYKNSLFVALVTAILGSLLAYLSALVNTRSTLNNKAKKSMDTISMITNSIPGMVLGLGYLSFFNGSSLKGTFAILIICNMTHFFTTPYLMAKNALSKMNPSFETTGELMGDSWIKTILRVVVPNSLTTLIEMFSYYFTNSMVTISAIIFLISAKTSVITSKIKELQHYAKFNEIFILSIIIFITNCFIKLCCENKLLIRGKENEK